MKTSDFDYNLPESSIAQTPAEPRDSSRLLVLNRAAGEVEHRIFRDLSLILRPDDLLVLNRTRVIPARIFAKKETGGRVELLLLRRRVSRILVEEGGVRGVLTEDGDVHNAPFLVCNADFKQAFLRLLRPGDIPEELARAVREAGQTPSNLQVCLGIDAGKVDLSAFREGHRMIYRRGDGTSPPRDGVPDWKLREVDPRDLAAGELEIALLGVDDPSLAPPGRAVLVIRTPAEHSHFRAYHPSPGARSGDYGKYKRRLGLALVEEIAQLLPGLQDSVEVMDVATPLTFEERGGRSEGAVAGWSWDFRDNPSGEARELVRTPVRGLFMAGYQAFSMLSMGGIPSAVLSGLRAAEYVLAGADPVDGMDIPGAT
jgi:phytoene dehydrogenase-like protein